MNRPLHSLLCLAVIAFIIAGFVFLHQATTRYHVPDSVRTPSTVAGVACLTLGTGLLVLGVLIYRKRD